MSFKLIASHVVPGPTFLMIVSRTLQPQRSIRLQNCGVRRKSTQSCYSLPVSSVKESFPLVIRSHWISNCPDESSQASSQIRPEPVSRYLSSLKKLTQQNVSLKKFEPSYRPIYPTSKTASQRPTLKVKRKLPYIPAALQRRNANRNYTQYYANEPGKSKDPCKLFWPPLYKCKRKDNVKTDSGEAEGRGPEELPPWLLPLYSCKSVKNDRMSGRPEPKFSGTAFRRKMEFLESMKNMQKKQANYTLSAPEVNNYQMKRSPLKKKLSAVEVLKRRIEEMQENRDTFQRMEDYFRKALSEDPLAEPKGNNTSVSYEPLYKTSKADQVQKQNEAEYTSQESRVRAEPLKINVVDNKKAKINTSSNQQQEGGILSGDGENTNNGTLHGLITEPRNNQVRKETVRSKEEPLDGDWSVESLKTRIKDMRSIKDDQILAGTVHKAMKQTPVGGEPLPKVGSFTYRSFHRNAPEEVGVINSTKKAHKVGTLIRTISSKGVRLRLGPKRSTQNRRYFSTLRPIETPKSGLRRSCYFSNISEPKTGWLSRLKRYFTIKKVKGHKMENWKQTPRILPYKRMAKEKHRTPSPILWVAKESEAKEKMIQSSGQQIETPAAEKVNPAVLNAEHRILAGVSRLQASKIQLETRDTQLTEVEKKLKKAEKKVSTMPWTKAMESVAKIVKPPVRCSEHPTTFSLSLDEKPETGYEWILKNRDIVEGLKRKSQELAGKPLVPSHVKQSIDNYKLPLRAQISQYRRSLERKDSEEFYIYGTSRRPYSTLFSERKPYFLKRSHIFVINTRTLNMDAALPRNVARNNLSKTQRSEESLPPKYCNHYKRLIESIYRPMQGSKVRDEANHTDSSKKTSSRVRIVKLPKNRPPTPRQALLTSLGKAAGPRMSDISPVSLKKQVDELKQLIRKTKGPERGEDESAPVPENDSEYKLRLRRIVKAAHENAKKMQFTNPRGTSESNTLQNKDPGHKIEPKRSASILQALLSVDKKKTELEKHFPVKTFSKHLQISRKKCDSPEKLTESRKPSKSLSNVYLKLKSLVESVTGKSKAQEIATNKSSIDVKSSKSLATGIPTVVNKMDNSTQRIEKYSGLLPQNATPNLQLELQCKKDPKPSMSVQLWKGGTRMTAGNSESKAVLQNDTPTYDELASLLAKAKDLFSSQQSNQMHKVALTESSPLVVPKIDKMAVQESVEDYKGLFNVSQLGAVRSLLTIHKEVSEFTKAGMKAINSELKIFETKLNYQPITAFLTKPMMNILPPVKASIIALPVVNAPSLTTKGDHTYGMVTEKCDTLQANRKDRRHEQGSQEIDYDRMWGADQSLVVDDGAEEMYQGTKPGSQNSIESIATPSVVVSSRVDLLSRVNKGQENTVPAYPNSTRSLVRLQTNPNSDVRGDNSNISTERSHTQKQPGWASISQNIEKTFDTHDYAKMETTQPARSPEVDHMCCPKQMAHAGNRFFPSLVNMEQPAQNKQSGERLEEHHSPNEEDIRQSHESSLNVNTNLIQKSSTCQKDVGGPCQDFNHTPSQMCLHKSPEELQPNSSDAQDELSTSDCVSVPSKEARENVSELLSKDPSINPDMVKKLKLPIPNEESREKTWYTEKTYGP